MSTQLTSLHHKHISLKAKMALFAGFDMPLQYSSVKEEVLAVRQKVGVFDVSHMGEFFVTGKDAVKFVDEMITNDFNSADMLKAVYSPLCREDGSTIDDLIAYKLGNEEVLICVNASNIEKDWNWFQEHVGKYQCEMNNKSNEYSLLAVQGPKVEEVLRKLDVLGNEEFPYYSILRKTVDGNDVIIARTGYTGEDGFEVFSTHDFANSFWDKLLENGVIPCGLASRDVLRIEVGYPLYGHELSDSLTPLDAALKWTVKTSKENFNGKNTLDGMKSKYRLVKLSLDKGIPREGYKVLNMSDEEIGYVTSGTMSVVLGKGVALCLIEREKFPQDKKFKINIRKNNIEATYHTKAFIEGGHK